MIYLDNAATSMTKPPCVAQAVLDAMGSMGNAGRGASSGALDAARVIHRCRERLARLVGCPRPDHVCFTQNSTMALNTALMGLVGPGDHVVSTVLEHNSVLRPLNRLARERAVKVSYAGCDAYGRLDMDELARLVVSGTRLVVLTHASNVTGNLVDVACAARIAHEAGALCVVDASQTAGCIDVDMRGMDLDVVCITGHKGLMGPQGTGAIVARPGLEVAPLCMGGTGVHSFDALQPAEWPTCLEAGTLNGHGIAGLEAALAFIEAEGGVAAVGAHEHALALRLYEGVHALGGITVYGDWELGPSRRAAVVALNIEGADSAEVSDALAQGWGIATRPGAHCAPLMHGALGTTRQGIVRLSCGYFTTEEEVDTAVEALASLCG